MGTEERSGINWLQVIGGALAALSSAVLLSTLGVAGTMIGAALGSVTVSVGSALYTRGLETSRQQVAGQAAALRQVTRARSDVDRAAAAVDGHRPQAGAELARADAELSRAEAELQRTREDSEPQAQDPPGATAVPEAGALAPASRWSRVPWQRVVLLAVGLFVIAMVVISGFELVSGRAVSSYTGGSQRDTGSTVPGLHRKPAAGTPTHDPSSPGAPTSEPTGPDEPGDGETVDPSATPAIPSPTVEATPSESPLESTSPGGSPEPSPTAGASQSAGTG